MVEIPKPLADKLNPLGPHFCLVAVKDKNPNVGGKGWQKPEKLMISTDSRLQSWLAKGGNYGVVSGYGLVIVDADIPEIKQLIEEKLPETFTVESPGSQGWHCYYLCGLEKPIRLRDKEGENVGDIQGPGKMVVGPGSIHPNGGVYHVVRDVPLAQVTKQQLVEALKPYVVPEKEVAQVEQAARSEKARTKIDLDITQVVPLAGLHRRGNEYFGSHPVHGSKTGGNFWVNPAKNCWHCFRHESGGGPLLWLAVEEGIIDCSEAGVGALRGEVFKRVLEKAKEHGYIKDVKLREEKPIILDHLNMIEDPNLTGKTVIVDAVVSSTSIAYLVPVQIEAEWEVSGNPFNSEMTIGEKDPRNLQFAGCNIDVKYKRLRRMFGQAKNIKIKENSYRTVYRVRVRPPVFTLEKRGEKIIDEKGFEYKAYDIYITSDKAITFQPSTLIRLEGVCAPNPRTQKITLLAYKATFPEETTTYNVEALNILKEVFKGKNIKERLGWILANFEAYSQIVGRRNLAEALFLDFFTPGWVKFNGEIQKGWGNTNLIGDTTTAKSETLRKMIMLLKAGMLITAETASAVGLTGTATQVESGGWFVDWGFLVLCDRKFLGIDGAHKLPFSQWAALAEAERSGVIIIAKAAKSSAYARTRQAKISNPIDREAGKFTTKTLADFLYPCQALGTTLDKTSIARLDNAVFADSRDVKAEDINVKFKGVYDGNLKILSEALKWCWSGKAKIEFTEKASDKLLEEATSLYNAFFCQTIPLVSIDVKWKLARLSTALAYLTLSTEDFTTLTVTEDHVKEVASFLREEYSRVGLNSLAQETRFEALTMEDVEFIIKRIIEATKAALDKETIENIFKFIVLQGRVTRDQLMIKFSLTEKNELRPLLATLASEKLTKIGRGLYPTPKLVQAYKLMLPSLPRVPRVEKGTPKDQGKDKMGVPSPSLVKLGKLGKNQTLFVCPLCASYGKQIFFNSQRELDLHIRGLHCGYPIKQGEVE